MSVPSRPRTLDDLDVDNRRVFVRVDFNVPLTPAGGIRDDTRIRAALPTLKALRDRGAKLIVASHLGRPKGEPNPKYSMEPVGDRLAELLECEVRLPDEVVGDAVTKLVGDATQKDLILLENLRFHPGETKNDSEFASQLASLCDAYVNDAFGASHRAHASVVGLPSLVRDRAAGLLLDREIASLTRLVDNPPRPFVAVVGGAKVSDKLGVLVALVERLAAGDALVIGGAMANTFLMAEGHKLGASLCEPDRLADCRRVRDKAAARDIRLLLPNDVRVATSLEATSGTVKTVSTEPLGDDEMALDIGPSTEDRYAAAVKGAKTVFWNGPMGLFENRAFASGTEAVGRAAGETDGFTVVGGGDSVAAIKGLGLADAIGHVSTGGGASLELVEGKVLPGIAALLEGDR